MDVLQTFQNSMDKILNLLFFQTTFSLRLYKSYVDFAVQLTALQILANQIKRAVSFENLVQFDNIFVVQLSQN